jgi:hypothetical protein
MRAVEDGEEKNIIFNARSRFQLVEADSAKWHALHEPEHGLITASQVPAIIDLVPRRKPKRVLREMLGLAPKFEGNEATEYGHSMEAIAVECCLDLHKNKFALWHYQPPMIVDTELKYGSSEDARVVDYDLLDMKPACLAVLEIKCPFHHGSGIDMRLTYYVQCQFQMFLSGIRKAYVFVYKSPSVNALYSFSYDRDFVVGTVIPILEKFRVALRARSDSWMKQSHSGSIEAATKESMKKSFLAY